MRGAPPVSGAACDQCLDRLPGAIAALAVEDSWQPAGCFWLDAQIMRWPGRFA